MAPWTVLVVVLLLLGLASAAITNITISDSSSCGDVHLNTEDHLYISYHGVYLYPPCTTEISGGTIDQKICISADYVLMGHFCFDSTRTSFKVKYFDGRPRPYFSAKETYGCGGKNLYSREEWCTPSSDAAVSIEGRDTPDMPSTTLHFHVYLQSPDNWHGLDEKETDSEDTFLTVMMVVGGTIAFGAVVTLVLVCVCILGRRRRRASRAPQQTVDTTTVPPFTPGPTQAYPMQPLLHVSDYKSESSGYQPAAAGYQPPPAGYQPPPAGYQPDPARNQPSMPGYQPQTARYQPPPAGFQPPPVKPSAPQHAGYQADQQEKTTPSAPSDGQGTADAPPPYPGV